jgi:hypothetical protein
VTATGVSASVTTVTVTRTQANSAGTEDIAGSTATDIWADQASTLSVEDPVSISATERWDTSGTVSFSNLQTAASRTTGTYYRQFSQIITLSGMDAAQSVSATVTQLNSATSATISGGTQTTVWADNSSTFTVPLQKVVTSNQERFQSYNSTASASYTVSATNTKTFVYQHEFNQLFRINEAHLGVTFVPMPSATFTAAVTTANNTSLGTVTFDTQVTDDYLQPSTGRVWVKNGTQTFGAVTWRGIDVRASGATCSVTSYGNCDIVTHSAHVGYGPPYHHFRIGTDDQTASVDNVSFNQNAATLTFNATSSGTKTTIVEFLGSDYGAVNQVTVNGAAVNPALWSVSTIDSTTSLLTITGVSFSENTFVITFAAAGSGGAGDSGGSGGGRGGSGGGGGGGSDAGIPIIAVPAPGGFAIGLNVSVPPFSVQPGESQTKEIIIRWEGATKVIIQSIVFESDPSIFKLGKSTPFAAVLTDEGMAVKVPLTVTLPLESQGVQKTVPMRVTAIAGANTAQQVVPVVINQVPTNELAIYIGVGLVVVAMVGAIFKKKRR